MTQSELLYKAWLNTEKPLTYQTKLDTKSIDFADPIKNKYFDKDFKGKCNLCGTEVLDGGISVKKFFSSNYMDWARHKCPESTHICKACTFCLGMNTQGRIALLRYPVVANLESLRLCSKSQFRNYLIEPVTPPFVMILPISQQKHLFHKSVISYSKDKFYCNYEENIIYCTSKIKNLICIIEKMRYLGLSLENIKQGILPGKIIKKYNLKQQIHILDEIDSIRELNMFGLAAKVSLSKQEMEERGIKYDL